MTKTIKAWSLVVALVFASSMQTACGNNETLARVGAVAVQLAEGFASEVNAIEASGLIKDTKKLEDLKKKATALKISANTLKSFLAGLKEVNASDKVAITSKIGELTSLVGALLLNPDVLGLSENSTAVKVLRYASITLNQIALTIAALQPPAASISRSAGSAGSGGIPVSKIKVTITPPPPELAHLLKAS